MFVKKMIGNLEFYTPFSSNYSEFRTLNRDDPAKDLNELKNQGIRFDSYTNDIVTLYNDINSTRINELISGLYRYCPSTQTNPEGLVKFDNFNQKTIDTLDIFDDFMDEITWFKNNKELYTQLGQKRTRGILLYGPPGYGKTQAINRLIRDNLNDSIVIFFDGENLPSKFFVDALNVIEIDKTTVFEEFSNIFSTFRSTSEVLEFLDGSNTINNCISILTTNNPEKIPQNVLRHGRIDRFIKVDKLSDKDISNLMKFFGLEITDSDDIIQLRGFSVVELKEIVFLVKRHSTTITSVIKLIKDRINLIKNDFAEKKNISLWED